MIMLRPNFSRNEISCRHCGLIIIDDPALDALQALREAAGMALTVVSGFRCPEHNRAVGGALHSRHLEGRAFDIARPASVSAQIALPVLAWQAGFRGFGFYPTFFHFDMRDVPALWHD